MKRYLEHAVKDIALSSHKMAFISGPRQCGKTTLAKQLLEERGAGAYYNWDSTEFRRVWTKTPSQIVTTDGSGTVPIIILDEIHKARLWKRTLKGIFDTLALPLDLIITGSARLTVYARGGDSLLGRYYHFRLHPLSVAELIRPTPLSPSECLEHLLDTSSINRAHQILEDLLRLGAFPEPFLSRDEKIARLWRTSRTEKVIREDLRDLSRLPELSQIEMLASLLPERIGSQFSRPALREDLEVSFDTVKRWINYLVELYYLFELKPYSRKISRSLKKEGKMYLWEYSEIEDEGAKFENLVAAHLLKACHYWSDTGEGKFELWYLKNKEKNEIDFLITLNNRPWLPVEAKLSKTEPSPAWKVFLPQLRCPIALQIVRAPNVFSTMKIGETTLVVASASQALSCFV